MLEATLQGLICMLDFVAIFLKFPDFVTFYL